MNKHSLIPLAATVLAALAMPGVAPAQGGNIHQGDVQRCEAPDGTAIYTDKACVALGATAMPMSGALLTRLAYAGASDPGFNAGGSDARRTPAGARRSAASGCARSSTQLAMDLQGSWALGDVNRIAESYHWVGLSPDQARSVMTRLERLAERPLWQAQFFDARIGGGMMQLADASASSVQAAGVMQLVFGDGDSRQLQNLDVERYHGCYFVQF